MFIATLLMTTSDIFFFDKFLAIDGKQSENSIPMILLTLCSCHFRYVGEGENSQQNSNYDSLTILINFVP